MWAICYDKVSHMHGWNTFLTLYIRGSWSNGGGEYKIPFPSPDLICPNPIPSKIRAQVFHRRRGCVASVVLNNVFISASLKSFRSWKGSSKSMLQNYLHYQVCVVNVSKKSIETFSTIFQKRSKLKIALKLWWDSLNLGYFLLIISMEIWIALRNAFYRSSIYFQ